MNKILEIKNLVKNYSNMNEVLYILRGINFSLRKGDSVSITGESGSGKSTFLNMIGGLDHVTGGEIIIDGEDIAQLDEEEITYFRNKKIGFIFQSHYLLEEFNAFENVAIPYLINKFNKRKSQKIAKELLDYMGLEKRFFHHPSQLSGGERQRVAIARAFINNPSIILADEPTGSLDEENANRALELLFNITKKENHSLIIVSHSDQIAQMADYNYHLESGLLTLR